MSTSSTTFGSRQTRRHRPQRPEPRRFHGVPANGAVSKVRWDRKFRGLLLVGLALIGWIGVHGVLTLLHTRDQAQRELSLVHRLARQNDQLRAQQRSLSQPATIIRDARKLGMVAANEQAYVVTGLSGH